MIAARIDQVKFPFFKGVSAAGSSDIFNNIYCYNALTLEVSGSTAVSLKVQGCINTEDVNKQPIPDVNLEWTDLGIINLSDFSVTASATSNGIYSVTIAGIAKVRVVLESVTGSTTVIGVMEA